MRWLRAGWPPDFQADHQLIARRRVFLTMMDIDFDLSSFGEPRKEVSSINKLQRAWISERAAPDILPYESRLLETISIRLKEQVIRLNIRVLTIDYVD